MFCGSNELALETDGDGEGPTLGVSGALPSSTHGASRSGILSRICTKHLLTLT